MIMKNNFYTAIGLMSGTSMDGVDASLIRSDGIDKFTNILDKYYKFDYKLFQKLINLKNSIYTSDDLYKYSNDLNDLERELTIFHSRIINEIIDEYKDEIDLIGFHGQTIFHDPKIGISKQLGDGSLLSQLTKKKVIYDFRQEDILNGGQGAPLTPSFHNLISKILSNRIEVQKQICFLNIGGISNITITTSNKEFNDENFKAFDIGPGNCLIDQWIRKNSKNEYDKNGIIARSGIIDKLILNQVIENFRINSYNNSLDVKDFDISFAKGLSLENGCATITKFTAYLISKGIEYANNFNKNIPTKYLICGGGRKNDYLIESIKKILLPFRNIDLEIIDNYSLDGDYIESQAFGYLAIRSFLNLPISFPQTTGCKKPITGGKLISNF